MRRGCLSYEAAPRRQDIRCYRFRLLQVGLANPFLPRRCLSLLQNSGVDLQMAFIADVTQERGIGQNMIRSGKSFNAIANKTNVI